MTGAIQQAIQSTLLNIGFANNEKAFPTIYVGLSAGVDSSVLLHALAQYFSASKQVIKAIHVHHGLSVNADDWAQQASLLCRKLSEKFAVKIDCIIERVQLGQNPSGIEQKARLARYQIFERYCQDQDLLFQGHHLDDQLETFFMRALRGSGLNGLAGIPAVRNLARENACQIVRPFLSLEKKQLITYAQLNQLSWVEDESNSDSKIERNWWRNVLLPQIWQRYPDNKRALARSISHVQHENSLLQQLITEKLSSGKTFHPALADLICFDLTILADLDRDTCMSYLRAWLAQHVDILPSAIQMQSVYDDMLLAADDSEPRFIWTDRILYRYKSTLFLFQESQVNQVISPCNHWQGENIGFGIGRLTCSLQANASDQALRLQPGCYQIRTWQPGDVAKPFGRSTRKMKKWWQDYRIPVWARQSWPIIVDEETGQIAAVPGLFVCHGFTGSDNCWSLDWRYELKNIKS